MNRWLVTRSAYRSSVLTHSPDCRVEWESWLIPPKPGEVSQALCVDQPARASEAVLRRRTASTPREKLRALNGDLPVAFDEVDDDVLAAQSGEQVCSGDAGFRVGAVQGLLETALVAERCLGVAHLRDGQPGGAGRGDRGSLDELQ